MLNSSKNYKAFDRKRRKEPLKSFDNNILNYCDFICGIFFKTWLLNFSGSFFSFRSCLRNKIFFYENNAIWVNSLKYLKNTLQTTKKSNNILHAYFIRVAFKYNFKSFLLKSISFKGLSNKVYKFKWFIIDPRSLSNLICYFWVNCTLIST